MSGHDFPTAADYALNMISSMKEEMARKDANRLRNEVLSEPEPLDVSELAQALGDYLIDQVANASCTIDCTDRAKPSIADQLVQLARSIQNNRKK
jgi:hypothetical protein